jgi:hypothetical protein
MNHTEIERLYLINGLSRSGNHLFITWLLSSFVDGSKWTNGKTETIVEKMEEIYFLNNIYPRSDFDLRNESKVNVENLLKLRAATKDGDDQSEALEDSMKKYLATQSQMRDFLEGKKKKIKVLIISIENNFSYILDMFANRFRKAKNVYKILILRDVLNLFASRFEAEQKVVKEIQKKDPSFKWHKYETDLLTFGYYVNNLFDSFNKKYITKSIV